MSQHSPAIEELIDRFDEAWSGERPPRIVDFLCEQQLPEYGVLLRELIKVDMEYRWRRKLHQHHDEAVSTTADGPEFETRSGVRVEYYIGAFPQLLESGQLPLDLIAEEYRIRRRWGDSPDAASFIVRFAEASHEVEKALIAVDRELASRQSFVDRPRSSTADGQATKDLGLTRHDLLVGGQIGDFRLLNELGQGAFARVFLAQQVSMQRLVALKVSDRPSQESPVLSQLEHPHIVRVFDERQVGKMSLMYMQYVAGGSLREALDRLHLKPGVACGERLLAVIDERLRAKGESSSQDRLTNPLAVMEWPEVVTRMGARLADALAHAHTIKILHRDIKPENILLTSDGEPMLADFNLSFGAGIALHAVERSFGGSLAYMSPEHLLVLMGEASPDSVKERSDLYSLGIVLHEMLFRRRPFDLEQDSPGTWEEHLAVRRQRSELPQDPVVERDELTRLIEQCFAYAVEARPASAEEVTRRLQWLSFPPLQQLISPKAGSWATRWGRHPLAWLLTLGMLPNAALSPLNIWANHRIAIENFDTAFFHRVEEPVVNLIAFPSGFLLAWWWALPLSQAMGRLRQNHRLSEDERSSTSRRSLRLPFWVAILALILWSSSGLIFPMWNQWASGSRVSSIDILGFFLSQLLHGVIAACLSLVMVSMVILRSIYPKALPYQASPDEQHRLMRLDRQLGWANACLEMTPLFAILAIALSDQFDKLVFVALAVVGFISHLVASVVIPQLRTAIRWLHLAVGPTSSMLRHRDSTIMEA